MQLCDYIEPYFQPIVWVNGKGRYAEEALFRFKGSASLQAGLFRRWEQSGYVVSVDCAMVRVVRRAMEDTRTMGRIAVNVSARTLELASDEYFGEILGLARTSRRVIVDITQTYRSDANTLSSFTRRCLSSGIYVALDDCRLGHEYGDDAFVCAVKPAFLKLDREWVDDCFQANDHRSLEKVMRVGLDHSAVIIAEGIDCPAKRDFVTSLGIKLLQGNWFGRPVEKSDTAEHAEREGEATLMATGNGKWGTQCG